MTQEQIAKGIRFMETYGSSGVHIMDSKPLTLKEAKVCYAAFELKLLAMYKGALIEKDNNKRNL